MSKVYLTAPIAKTVETNDGGREVWGFATLERVDKSGEIADFEGTVKAFEKWSSEIEKRTQGKSKGNVRIMHGSAVAGKAIHWEPTETTIEDENGNPQTVKAIWTGAYIPPTKPEVIKDIDEGILSAFSIGGSYAKRWYDETSKAFRFIPELSEYSLVDNPCVPGADITQVISKSYAPWDKEDRNIGGEIVNEELEKSRQPQGSFEDLKSRLCQAINSKLSGPFNSWWDGDIIATYPDRVVVFDWPQQKYFELSYQDENGNVTLGDPIEVAQAFVPIEAQKTIEDKMAKRKAESDKLSEGGDNKNEDGKVETPTESEKGSEKSMTEEDLKKAAEEAGLDFEKVKNFFKALNPIDQPPEPISVTTVDGDGDGDQNKEFPNPPSSEEKINIEEGQKSVENAEKETSGKAEKSGESEVTKTDEEVELAKAGKAVSKSRLLHMHHAIKHMEAAMNGGAYGPDEHVKAESEFGQGNTGEEAPEVNAEKSFTSTLQKSVGVFVSEELSKTFDKFEALVKGLASSESLTKALDRLEAVESLVKEIHDTPQVGGPVLNGASPDLVKFTPNQDITGLEEQALENFIKTTSDAQLRDRLGQELAIRRAKSVLR